jgi:cell wall-associated NlpC family hydrolase
MAAPAVPVALMIAGGYLTWFGVHYWRTDVAWPSDPVKAVLTGKPLPVGTKSSASELTTSIVGPGMSIYNNVTGLRAAAGTGPGSTFGDSIAHAALQYQATGYVWGGNASRPGDWDCSSFVSKVLGQDLGLTLPGGGRWGDPGYPPGSHGPGSTQYMLYGQGVSLADVQPGDLIVSTEHIGICIGNGQMISAEDPADGTKIGTFPAGFPSGPPVYRRVIGAGTGAGGAPFPGAVP